MRRKLLAVLTLYLQLMIGNLAVAQPATQFAGLESQLLGAEVFSLDFHVNASGAVEADIRGRLQKNGPDDIQISASGVFAGQDIDLIARQDSKELIFGNRNEPSSAEPQGKLWEALVIGFTRMGILHNIANLSAGLMPDHAEGGVGNWVEVTEMQRDSQTFEFDITVAGVPSGAASLFVDGMENPVRREQTVAFPGGEMRVVEVYSNNSLTHTL